MVLFQSFTFLVKIDEKFSYTVFVPFHVLASYGKVFVKIHWRDKMLMKEEDDSEDDEDYDKEKLSHKAKVPLTPEWESINEVSTTQIF